MKLIFSTVIQKIEKIYARVYIYIYYYYFYFIIKYII